LFDLITIYDDEESSEVSLVTPVKITEEKNLRKHPPWVPMLQVRAVHRMSMR
jgi:hypothetical protein